MSGLSIFAISVVSPEERWMVRQIWLTSDSCSWRGCNCRKWWARQSRHWGRKRSGQRHPPTPTRERARQMSYVIITCAHVLQYVVVLKRSCWTVTKFACILNVGVQAVSNPATRSGHPLYLYWTSERFWISKCYDGIARYRSKFINNIWRKLWHVFGPSDRNCSHPRVCQLTEVRFEVKHNPISGARQSRSSDQQNEEHDIGECCREVHDLPTKEHCMRFYKKYRAQCCRRLFGRPRKWNMTKCI